MSTQSFTLTLSRWHAVAERLQAKARELTVQAQQTLGRTQVAAYHGQEQTLRTDATDAKAKIALVRRLHQQLGTIRARLGQANQEQGVTAALAEQQVLKNTLALLRELGGIDTSQQASIDTLADTFAKRAGTTVAVYDRQVAVAMLTREEVKAFQAEAEAVQAKAYALADQINDLNREKLSIDLDQDIAALAGL